MPATPPIVAAGAAAMMAVIDATATLEQGATTDADDCRANENQLRQSLMAANAALGAAASALFNAELTRMGLERAIAAVPTFPRVDQTGQPTVALRIADSSFTLTASGEVLETVDHVNNTPDWTNAGICDHRGVAGASGYATLLAALEQADRNAQLVIGTVDRIGD